jgi:hypothetical protein
VLSVPAGHVNQNEQPIAEANLIPKVQIAKKKRDFPWKVLHLLNFRQKQGSPQHPRPDSG